MPLRISLNFNEIHTFYKGNVRESNEIRWNPKGYPLGFHWISMRFIHITMGIPCKMLGDPLKFNETLRGIPLGFHWISMNFTHFTNGYPLQNVRKYKEIHWNPKGYVPRRISLNFNEVHTFYKEYRLQNVRKSIEIHWNPKGYPLRISLIFGENHTFYKGYPLAKCEGIHRNSLKS